MCVVQKFHEGSKVNSAKSQTKLKSERIICIQITHQTISLRSDTCMHMATLLTDPYDLWIIPDLCKSLRSALSSSVVNQSRHDMFYFYENPKMAPHTFAVTVETFPFHGQVISGKSKKKYIYIQYVYPCIHVYGFTKAFKEKCVICQFYDFGKIICVAKCFQ